MLTGILHTHTLVVTIYLIIGLLLAISLLMGRLDFFEKVNKLTMMPKRITEVLMLVTGIFLFTQSSAKEEVWLWVKVGLLFVSIGVSIVGMNQKNGMLLLLSSLILIYIFGVAETRSLTFQSQKNKIEDARKSKTLPSDIQGQKLYTVLCLQCHGADGKLGVGGAKDLGASTMADADMKSLIRQGKGLMAAFPNLSHKEVEDLVFYAKTLRK